MPVLSDGPDIAELGRLVKEKRTDGHQSVRQAAIRHLSSDPSLSSDAAEAIARVVRDMYKALATRKQPRRRPLVLHLRAASALRPGAPERLAALLTDMHSGLEARAASKSQ